MSPKQLCHASLVLTVIAIIAGCDFGTYFKTTGVLSQGKDAFAKKDFDLALSCFFEAIRLDPEDAEAHCWRGQVYSAQWAKRNVERALVDFNRSISLNPTFAKAYFNRGLAFREKYELSIKENSSEDINSNYYREAVTSNIDRAIADFASVIRITPKDPQAYYYRGLTYGDVGDFDRSIKDFTGAIQIDPNFIDAYSMRGFAYRASGKIPQANADFEKAKNLRNAKNGK